MDTAIRLADAAPTAMAMASAAMTAPASVAPRPAVFMAAPAPAINNAVERAACLKGPIAAATVTTVIRAISVAGTASARQRAVNAVRTQPAPSVRLGSGASFSTVNRPAVPTLVAAKKRALAVEELQVGMTVEIVEAERLQHRHPRRPSRYQMSRSQPQLYHLFPLFRQAPA
ncbi:MAG: hypothetical protein Q9225_007479 [Loekoesia sp. 1 TL-2023]